MENVYEHEIIFEGNGKVSVGELAREMENSTRLQMKELGVDTIKLIEEGILWVICFTQLDIKRLPDAGRRVICRSWPSEPKFGMISRRFKFLDENEELLMQTSSFFTMMDAKTRSRAKDPEFIKSIPLVKFEDDMKLPKLAVPFPERLDNQSSHEVVESEIDDNGHVNNSYYFDWSLELLGEEFNKNHTPKSIWLMYNKEIRLGDVVDFKYTLENNVLYAEGTINKERAYSVKVDYYE